LKTKRLLQSLCLGHSDGDSISVERSDDIRNSFEVCNKGATSSSNGGNECRIVDDAQGRELEKGTSLILTRRLIFRILPRTARAVEAGTIYHILKRNWPDAIVP
jgi:hypothetical protein